MFMLLWGPTIAAVSVILDHAEDSAIVRQALDSVLLCARIASCHRLDEVCCISVSVHALTCIVLWGGAYQVMGLVLISQPCYFSAEHLSLLAEVLA